MWYFLHTVLQSVLYGAVSIYCMFCEWKGKKSWILIFSTLKRSFLEGKDQRIRMGRESEGIRKILFSKICFIFSIVAA